MKGKDASDLKRYSYNIFAFPEGYFEKKSAAELGVSEDVRLKLAEMQKAINADFSEDTALVEFVNDFNEDW